MVGTLPVSTKYKHGTEILCKYCTQQYSLPNIVLDNSICEIIEFSRILNDIIFTKLHIFESENVRNLHYYIYLSKLNNCLYT